MTAISFYFASEIRLEPDLSHIFQEICKVEMHHMKIFGELARCLGETALLWTNCGGRKVWWSPSFTDYPGSIFGILEASLQGEQAAVEKYQWQLDRIDDPYIQENLKRIIEDEEIHIRIFKKLNRYFKEGMMP